MGRYLNTLRNFQISPSEEPKEPKKPQEVGSLGLLGSASSTFRNICSANDEEAHADILECHLDAVAAEPFILSITQPSASLTASDEIAIRGWLSLIEETEQAVISEVLEKCRLDKGARDYFLSRASEDSRKADSPKPDPFPDDRRTCKQCSNLRYGICTVAAPGAVVSANRGYKPRVDVLIRCEGFVE